MSERASLFPVGARVVYVGQFGGNGTVASVRDSRFGPLYRVTWDDGKGENIEYGEDELRAE